MDKEQFEFFKEPKEHFLPHSVLQRTQPTQLEFLSYPGCSIVTISTQVLKFHPKRALLRHRKPTLAPTNEGRRVSSASPLFHSPSKSKVARWQNLIPSFPWIAPTPSTLAQSKESKGSNFAIWQPWAEPAQSWQRRRTRPKWQQRRRRRRRRRQQAILDSTGSFLSIVLSSDIGTDELLSKDQCSYF